MSLPRYEPMLAALDGHPVSSDWRYELKWDGIRALLYWHGDRLELTSRRGHDITGRYPELAGFTSDRPVVVDGEVVALDENGLPSFERLQSRMNLMEGADARVAAGKAPVSFVAFDLLHSDRPVIAEPLERRREFLAELDLPAPFTTSELYDDGEALWEFVRDRSLEGMIAKRLGSRYQSGVRSPDWRKIPYYHRLLAVVGGFTPGERSRSTTFGSLAIGLRVADGLRWVGAVGSGFNDRQLVDIRAALDQMRVPESPFLAHPDLPTDWAWVEPQLVAVVQYKQLTRVGRLRAPVFLGFSGEPPVAATWEQISDETSP